VKRTQKKNKNPPTNGISVDEGINLSKIEETDTK
jgi:hypothetical protein